jgi:hypothetical protein
MLTPSARLDCLHFIRKLIVVMRVDERGDQLERGVRSCHSPVESSLAASDGDAGLRDDPDDLVFDGDGHIRREDVARERKGRSGGVQRSREGGLLPVPHH